VVSGTIHQMNQTLDYYNTNADAFVSGTVNADMHTAQEKFITELPAKAYILDFGCGSGRDTKFFMSRGFSVRPVDGSAALCIIASEYTGIPVQQMLFEELCDKDLYDGIWACSSILHLPVAELASVFKKMYVALKKEGILYTSFKYGCFEGYRNGRYFTDMTEQTFQNFLSAVHGFIIKQTWITADVRPGRSNEKWLNVILRKASMIGDR